MTGINGIIKAPASAGAFAVSRLFCPFLEVSVGALEALVQRDGRSPAERAARAAIGEHGLVDVAGARFKVTRFDCLVSNIAEDGDEFLEARLRLRREVVGMVDMLGAERGVDARGDVAA